VVTKADLVRAIATRCGRADVSVTDSTTTKPVDRTLATLKPELNEKLWRAAGYEAIPRVEQLVAEMAIN
jgi:hypothetical protein